MIGIDIESIERFKNLFEHKNKLLQKMFNPSEWDYAQSKAHPAQTLTGIWCAKEAVLKAVYSTEEVFIKDITIKYKSTGEPFPEFTNDVLKNISVKISISHAKEYATAVAIVLI